MFSGIRVYPDSLMPLQISPSLFAGYIFKSRNVIAELSWNSVKDVINRWPEPRRDQLELYKRYWEAEFDHVDIEQMPELFEGWPRNTLEEWASDYNYAVHLRYDVFYSASSLESFIVVNGYGLHSLDWREYQESYHQAQTMHKLKENL